MTRTCTRCGTVLPEGAHFCPNCGWGGPASEHLPMKWFKFIIYVQLFLSALGNLILGIGLLAGTAYGEYSGLVYAVAPALRAVDVVIGLALLALAAAAIVVRQRLARYRAGAPRLYLLLLAVSLGVSLVYLLAGSAVVGELLLSASTLASLAGSGVMLPVNRIYFRKREGLFAN